MRSKQLASVLSAVAFAACPVGAQTLGVHSLTGDYHLVELMVQGRVGALTDVRNHAGKITFDGKGNYTSAGRRGLLAGALEPLNRTGTYSVGADGSFALLYSPVESNLLLTGGIGSGTRDSTLKHKPVKPVTNP